MADVARIEPAAEPVALLEAVPALTLIETEDREHAVATGETLDRLNFRVLTRGMLTGIVVGMLVMMVVFTTALLRKEPSRHATCWRPPIREPSVVSSSAGSSRSSSAA